MYAMHSIDDLKCRHGIHRLFYCVTNNHCRSPLGRKLRRSPFLAPYADYIEVEHKRGIICLYPLPTHSSQRKVFLKRSHAWFSNMLTKTGTTCQAKKVYMPSLATWPQKPVFTCRARSLLPPPQAILKRSELVFTCRARPLLPGCHCLTLKVVFLRGQNRFLPAGRRRSCHCLTAKVVFSKRSEPVFTCRRPQLPPPHPPWLFF
jgi:hypothetical protein